VLEQFYERHDEYMQLAVNNLRLNVPIFNTHRMAAEYVSKYDLELPAETDARIKDFQKLYRSETSDA
jgi:starch phosphorylase